MWLNIPKNPELVSKMLAFRRHTQRKIFGYCPAHAQSAFRFTIISPPRVITDVESDVSRGLTHMFQWQNNLSKLVFSSFVVRFKRTRGASGPSDTKPCSWRLLTLSLPSSKSTFSRHFKEEMYELCSENWCHNHACFICLSDEKPSSSYCVMLYFWWDCRGNLILIALGSECVNRNQCSKFVRGLSVAFATDLIVLKQNESSSLQSPCESAPCKNGATCQALFKSQSGYSCRCEPGFYGSNCQEQGKKIYEMYKSNKLL